MQLDDYTHLLEAALAALAAALAWCWRLAVKDHDRHRRIELLEKWQHEHMREYRNVADTLTELQQGQAVQVAELRNICRSLDELRKDHRKFVAGRIVGGRRRDDPVAGEDDE